MIDNSLYKNICIHGKYSSCPRKMACPKLVRGFSASWIGFSLFVFTAFCGSTVTGGKGISTFDRYCSLIFPHCRHGRRFAWCYMLVPFLRTQVCADWGSGTRPEMGLHYVCFSWQNDPSQFGREASGHEPLQCFRKTWVLSEASRREASQHWPQNELGHCQGILGH